MLINHTEGVYYYVFKASRRTQRVLSWSPKQCTGEGDGLFLGIYMAIALYAGLVLTFTGLSCFIVGGNRSLGTAMCALVGLLLLWPLLLRGVRWLLRGWVIYRGALDRFHAVSITRNKSGDYESNSFAVQQLLSTPHGRELLDAITAQPVRSSWDLFDYKRDMQSNPGNKFLPKVKVTWEGFLVETTQHDLGLLKAGGSQHEEAKRLRREVCERASEVSKRLRDDLCDHNAQCKGIAEGQEFADETALGAELGAIAPLYRKETPQLPSL